MDSDAIQTLLQDVTPGPWAYNVRREVGPLHTEDDQAYGMICDVVCEANFDADHMGNARFIAAARELVPALATERDAQTARADAAEAEVARLRGERYRLAYAITGGEDAPGYLDSLSVDALVDVARNNRCGHMYQIDQQLKAEAARDAAEAREQALLSTYDAERKAMVDNVALKAEVARLQDENERLLADKSRLDFLDECNSALNKRSGTVYGWAMIMNHNVNRLMTERHHLAVDLHDSKAHGVPSCRIAIDQEMRRIFAARAALQRKAGE